MADWQPIATAPKDGALLLFWIPSGREGYYSLGSWEGRGLLSAKFSATWRDNLGERIEPTHFQTLPDPPAVLAHAAPETET